MYFPALLFLWICSAASALRRHSGAVLPLVRFWPAAAAARAAGAAAEPGFRLNSAGHAVFVVPGAEGAAGLCAKAVAGCRNRQRLYRRCLDEIAAAGDIEGLSRTVRSALGEVEAALVWFTAAPIVYLLFFREVEGFMRALVELITRKCDECRQSSDARLLEAAPRSRQRRALFALEVETVQKQVEDIARRLAMPSEGSVLPAAGSQASSNQDYWSHVHGKAYINGLAITMKVAAMAMINRLVIPMLIYKATDVLGSVLPAVNVLGLGRLLSLTVQ